MYSCKITQFGLLLRRSTRLSSILKQRYKKMNQIPTILGIMVICVIITRAVASTCGNCSSAGDLSSFDRRLPHSSEESTTIEPNPSKNYSSPTTYYARSVTFDVLFTIVQRRRIVLCLQTFRAHAIFTQFTPFRANYTWCKLDAHNSTENYSLLIQLYIPYRPANSPWCCWAVPG